MFSRRMESCCGQSYGEKWLGDPFFAPVFEELNRRKAVVFVHPIENTCCTDFPREFRAAIEYGTDTTRAIVRMIYTGASKRYPDMRMIFSHAGGTMPFLIGRFVGRVPIRKRALNTGLHQISRPRLAGSITTLPKHIIRSRWKLCATLCRCRRSCSERITRIVFRSNVQTV